MTTVTSRHHNKYEPVGRVQLPATSVLGRCTMIDVVAWLGLSLVLGVFCTISFISGYAYAEDRKDKGK